MPFTLSIQQFCDRYAKRLKLEWISGQEHAQGFIGEKEDALNILLIGYLNLVRPCRIQVLGKQELQYFSELGKNSQQASINRLFSQKPALLIIVDDVVIPDEIAQGAIKSQIPLLTSSTPGNQLIEYLRHDLTTLTSNKITRHGVFMDVMGIGILLIGPSGIGKSELALQLINRGHRLIADDATEFKRIAPNHIRGNCPDLLTDFLEVRGLGILNIRAMFGDNALIRYKRLRLIVDLEPLSDEEIKKIDRLGNTHQFTTILDVDIPEVIIPIAPGRDIAIIVEAAVRNHLLSMNGYNSADDFMKRQQQIIDKK